MCIQGYIDSMGYNVSETEEEDFEEDFVLDLDVFSPNVAPPTTNSAVATPPTTNSAVASDDEPG